MPSLFKTAPIQPAAISAPNDISANTPASLRRGLGLWTGFKVKRAEDRAKGEGLTTITETSVKAMADVVCTDIEAQRSLLKAGIVAKAVPQFAAMATELQARAAVSHEQFTNINEEGLLAILKGRHAFNEEIRQMLTSGLITREEAEEMAVHRHTLAAQDLTRLDQNVTRAKDALDGMVSGATSHIVAPITKQRDMP
ncbi:MAG: hypothetical protein ACYCTW_12610 [Sulfuricella sp.]